MKNAYNKMKWPYGSYPGMTPRRTYRATTVMKDETNLYKEVNNLLKRWERDIAVCDFLDTAKRSAIRHCAMQLQGVLAGEKAEDV